MREEISAGARVTVRNNTSGKTFFAVCDLSQRERSIILAGGALNFAKSQTK